MSQTVTTTPAVAPISIKERIQALLIGTPGTLRALSVGTFAVLIMFGALGALAVNARSSDLVAARGDADQLVRIQSIRTNLVQADANATNTFLLGGLEPRAQRAAYTDGVNTAASLLAQAASKSGADAKALSGINKDLTQYTALMEAARVNNRQGFAVASAYLKTASSQLHTNILPVLSDLVTANQNRVNHDYSRSASAANFLWFLALLSVVVLIAAQIWLALRMNRTFNIGLATATVCLLVAVLFSGLAMVRAQYKADQVHSQAYRLTADLAQARIDGFDAKSNESLTLIFRGSGQDYETAFAKESTDAVQRLLNTQGGSPESIIALVRFREYLGLHKQIRKLDDSGNWDKAVATATDTTRDGSNAAFASFDTDSAGALNRQVRAIDNDLSSARTPLTIIIWLVLLLGVAAAVASVLGFSVRLREYR